MLKMISWTGFLGWMGILAVSYYLIVLARYYRREAVALLTGKKLKSQLPESQNQDQDKKPVFFSAMEKAIAALTESLREVTAGGGNKDDALYAVRGVLRNYAYLKDTPYAIAIHHFLLLETNQSVRLNEDELKGLWD
jgi:hypothetical protein